jgi:hypothetical protein
MDNQETEATLGIGLRSEIQTDTGKHTLDRVEKKNVLQWSANS